MHFSEMCVTLVLLAIVFGLLLTGFLIIKRNQSYFKDHGIPYLEPSLFSGNMAGVGKTVTFGYPSQKLYNTFKGTAPLAGLYFFMRHAFVIIDLDLVRNILIKDFAKFTERGIFYNEKDDPLTAHLFSLSGLKWRNLRHKLSPTFTSGKMKFMFPTIVDVSGHLASIFRNTIEAEPVVEVRDFCARYTSDVIGTCAFGIDCNSLKDPNGEFIRIGKRALTERRHNLYVQNAINSNPNMARRLGMKIIPDDISEFFIRIVRDTAEYREKNNIQRKDFMNLLLELKNSPDQPAELNGLTVEEIAAQAFLFFAAGFETSSTTMSFCLFELACNQAVQDKARKEIFDVLARHKGEFTYDAMKEMVYLDRIIHETLRKYPIAQTLIRKSNEDYPVENTPFVIEKGWTVLVPIYAVHHDPDIYPDPDTFDPDRFLPEEIAKRHPLAWLPFGDGPRNCIGLRFGKMQTHIGLVSLLQNFKFSPCSKTVIPIEFDIKNFFLASKGGIHLKVDTL